MSGVFPAPVSPERITDSIIKALDKRERQTAEYDVFLSYANADGILAEKIHQALDAKNLRCFMSGKELTGGDNFNELIRNALLNSREVCVLYTPNSKKSEWVLTEWGAFWVLKKRIVPIIHRIDIDSLPDRLKSLQAIDFSDLEQYVTQVKNRCSQ